MARTLTPEQLFRELVEHIAESLDAACAGDAEAKQWLCESFPAYTQFFRATWHARQPETMRPVIRVFTSPAQK